KVVAPTQDRATGPGLRHPVECNGEASAGPAEAQLAGLDNKIHARLCQLDARTSDSARQAPDDVVADAIHGPRSADALGEPAFTAAILDGAKRPRARYAKPRRHGETLKRTRSPARNAAGGSRSTAKLRNSVLPITCQPVGISVAAIAVCPAANKTLPAGTTERT